MTFDQWILSDFSKLNVEVKKLTWTLGVLPHFHDYVVYIKYKNEIFYGRGTDLNEEVALKKAISEAIERIFLINSDLKNSNGIAAHPDLRHSQINSMNELVERDLFLSHFLTNTPFNKLSSTCLKNLSEAFSFVETNKHDVSLFATKKSNYGETIVCVISGRNDFGCIIGLSLNSGNLHEAIEKSFIEAFRQYFYLLSNNKLTDNISLEDFLELSVITIKDHGKLALDCTYYNSISDLFSSSSDLSNTFYEPHDFNFLQLKTTDSELNKIPIYVNACLNDQCQKLFVGVPLIENISLKGISTFLNKDFDLKLNLKPHPLA